MPEYVSWEMTRIVKHCADVCCNPYCLSESNRPFPFSFRRMSMMYAWRVDHVPCFSQSSCWCWLTSGYYYSGFFQCQRNRLCWLSKLLTPSRIESLLVQIILARNWSGLIIPWISKNRYTLSIRNHMLASCCCDECQVASCDNRYNDQTPLNPHDVRVS